MSSSPPSPKAYLVKPSGILIISKKLEFHRRCRRSYVIKVLCISTVVWIIIAIFYQFLQLPAPYEVGVIEVEVVELKGETKATEESSDVGYQITPKRSHNNNEDYGYLRLPEGDLRPGEMGKPLILPGNLTEEQKKMVTEGWSRNAFNQFASDLISVRRTLPDYRDEWCTKTPSLPVELLPVTSVIMVFHNEAWSVLLRSVHSVLDRSPPELLEEIILVDDFSDLEHLKVPLESYMMSYPKVKILRAEKRVGLIRARLIGAEVAIGPVLTFLDSHIEATTGWLEPLLERIYLNKSTVVCPVIDLIDDETLEFKSGDTKANSVGGFDWYLTFTWHAVPERERLKHQNGAEPVHSPTMAGGLFSIDRDFFYKLGAYDPGFDIWGGENLEISFKIWMCGGTLEIVPCSHVGHIFRKRSPYKWRTGVNVLRRNTVRLAKVWMDDYAKYFYDRIGNDLGEYGDISSRLQLRESLHCKDFKWYLTNVYPEQFIPGDAVGQGEVRNLGLGNRTCLDSPASRRETNKLLGLYPCHGMGGHQYWSYSKDGEIRRDDMCVDYGGRDIIIFPCQGNPNQRWSYDIKSGLLRHPASRKCMALRTTEKLVMVPCDASKDVQRWRFQHFNSSLLI